MTNHVSEQSLGPGMSCWCDACLPPFIQYEPIESPAPAITNPPELIKELIYKRTIEEPDFYAMLLDAEDHIEQGNLRDGLDLFRQAYQTAWTSEALGIDYCYEVMQDLHYYNFEEDAYSMCAEIAQRASKQNDYSILRMVWLLLADIGTGPIRESALCLRDELAGKYPDVMKDQYGPGRF
jgi:hypothetical protein